MPLSGDRGIGAHADFHLTDEDTRAADPPVIIGTHTTAGATDHMFESLQLL